MARGADVLDAVIVGAGWAGLGVSQALIQRGLRHRVFERGRIGETWLTQRWDSFQINTANIHTVMPGQTYAGPDPNGAMTAKEFVALLEDYVQQFDLPVETNTPVTRIDEEDGLYRLSIPNGQVRARNVDRQQQPELPGSSGDVHAAATTYPTDRYLGISQPFRARKRSGSRDRKCPVRRPNR